MNTTLFATGNRPDKSGDPSAVAGTGEEIQAILIDPREKTVRRLTLDYASGSLQDLVMTPAGFAVPWFISFGLHFDHLYVEKDDYLTDFPGFLYGTLPLFGKCLVIGRDDEAKAFTSCRATTEETLLHIRFLEDAENSAHKNKRKEMHR